MTLQMTAERESESQAETLPGEERGAWGGGGLGEVYLCGCSVVSRSGSLQSFFIQTPDYLPECYLATWPSAR